MNVKSTFKVDGKDHPLTGSPHPDTLNVGTGRQPHLFTAPRRAWQKVGETTRTASKDGKELTLASKGTGADGVAYNNVMVYDKK